MIIDITGVTSGSSPYLIYLCDWDLSSCFFITGVTTIPPIVQIDSNYYFPGLQLLKVKIFDNDGCFEIIEAPCLPTPVPEPPPPTPTACMDFCTYWQITILNPCKFKLFDCYGNVVEIITFNFSGTYYVESVLQPQPVNQNCTHLPIVNLGPCPVPTPVPTPIPTQPEPTPCPICCSCISWENLTGNSGMTFTYINCSGNLILSATTNGDVFTICGRDPISYSPTKLIPTIGNPCIDDICVDNTCTTWLIENMMNEVVKLYYTPCCGSIEEEYDLNINELYVFNSFGPPYAYNPITPNIILTSLGGCN